MNRLVLLAVFVLGTIFARPSSAAPNTDVALPLEGETISVAEGVETGTAVVFGQADHRTKAFVVALDSGRVMRVIDLGPPSGVIRAVRGGRSIFVVAEHDDAVVLTRLGADLHVEAQTEIGHGRMPSIDYDAPTTSVVVAFFEDRPPTEGMRSRNIGPPHAAMHVQVREAETMRLIGFRMFRRRDGGLLDPHAVPAMAAHAVATHHGRVVIALPMLWKARLLTATLPLLTVEEDRDIDRKTQLTGSYPLYHVGGGIAGRDVKAVPFAGTPTLARVPDIDVDDYVEAWGKAVSVSIDEGAGVARIRDYPHGR